MENFAPQKNMFSFHKSNFISLFKRALLLSGLLFEESTENLLFKIEYFGIIFYFLLHG